VLPRIQRLIHEVSTGVHLQSKDNTDGRVKHTKKVPGVGALHPREWIWRSPWYLLTPSIPLDMILDGEIQLAFVDHIPRAHARIFDYATNDCSWDLKGGIKFWLYAWRESSSTIGGRAFYTLVCRP
jgi:hypothetical protein